MLLMQHVPDGWSGKSMKLDAGLFKSTGRVKQECTQFPTIFSGTAVHASANGVSCSPRNDILNEILPVNSE